MLAWRSSGPGFWDRTPSCAVELLLAGNFGSTPPLTKSGERVEALRFTEARADFWNYRSGFEADPELR